MYLDLIVDGESTQLCSEWAIEYISHSLGEYCTDAQGRAVYSEPARNLASGLLYWATTIGEPHEVEAYVDTSRPLTAEEVERYSLYTASEYLRARYALSAHDYYAPIVA